MDWGKLPDLATVGLLACAFASVARRSQTPVSELWLTGWILVVAHFAAFLFVPSPGIWGILAADLGLAALVGAGILFMYASIPYRKDVSSRLMLGSLLGINLLYIALLNGVSGPSWMLDVAAALFGAVPLALGLFSIRRVSHPLRWMTVSLYCALSVFLLLVQNRPNMGADFALNGVLFTVFFGCCLFFAYNYRGATAGAFITIAGFFAWAAVFLLAPLLATLEPKMQIESEVWNLPKYIVAVGMILLLLEGQIEHNKYLALHDELTGLPNRRLFLDRLDLALERARRAGTKMALLVVDLDHFKQVNDTLGHHAGDLLLQQVGEIFINRVRRLDTVARTGGDEFSVILEEPITPANAAQVVQSLLQLLNQPLPVGEHMVCVGASIGVATFPDDATDKEALCIAADLRMYDNKHAPKGSGTDGVIRKNSPSPVIKPMSPVK